MPAENITTSEKSEDLNELSIFVRQEMLANAAEDKTVKSRGKKMQKKNLPLKKHLGSSYTLSLYAFRLLFNLFV